MQSGTANPRPIPMLERSPERSLAVNASSSANIDPLLHALSELGLALDRASGSDAATVEPVISGLMLVERLFKVSRVSPEQHAAVRSGIDNALTGLSSLVIEVQRERDEVGRELARVRRQRPVPTLAAPNRLDCET